MRHRSLALAALLLAAQSAASRTWSGEVIQSYDSYRSWFVACDNGLHCVAKGLSDVYAGAEIDIDRDAGPAGGITLSIRSDRPLALSDIAIDGRSAGLSAPAWTIYTADGSTTVSSDDLHSIRALIAKLRGASKMMLGGDAEVSLDGLSPALTSLDVRQGRRGGVTAITALGPLAASHVPTPSPLPHVPRRRVTAKMSKGEAERLIASTRAGQRGVIAAAGCETELPAMLPEAHALDPRKALIFLPCVRGAYQESWLGFIAARTDGHARRLVLPLPYRGNDPDRSGKALFTNAGFDAQTGTLSTAAKGRARGDCGMSASWIWNGSAFVLASMALQRTCGGVEAGDWPTIFRSRQG